MIISIPFAANALIALFLAIYGFFIFATIIVFYHLHKFGFHGAMERNIKRWYVIVNSALILWNFSLFIVVARG